MKKACLYIFLLSIAVFIFLQNHIMVFSYINPKTETKSLKYIANTIKILNKGFDYAKFSCKQDGIKIKYIYQNAYGSGFIDNPIPNDLDYAIGIDLGEYEYNGDNKKELAEKLIENMNAFQYSLNFYFNTQSKDRIFTTETPFENFQTLKRISDTEKNIISNTIDLAIKDGNYVQYTKKGATGNHNENGIDVPYIMKSGEILLEDRHLITLYSNSVKYNDSMPKYLREVSIIPEYFATIKYNGKKYPIEFVAESSFGVRLQLARRFYVPQIFVQPYSIKYLKNSNYLNNDQDYLFYRLYTYKRHLQDTNTLILLNNKPMKVFKRLLQTADIIYPVINDEKYNEIHDYVLKNLNKPSLILLNWYSNICTNLNVFLKYPEMFISAQEAGEIKTMLDTMEQVLNLMDEIKDLNKNDVKLLRNFYENDLKKLLKVKNEQDIRAILVSNINENYPIVLTKLTELINSQTENGENTQKFINDYNKIYLDAGFHKVSLYWLDNNTIGILKDSFTEKIDNLNKFVKENNLVEVNYKLIDLKDAPTYTMRYDVFARYNPTSKEEALYNRLCKTLLEDKKNFSIKKKYIFY